MTRLVTAALLFAVLSPLPANACEPDDICEPPVARKYPSLARQIGITVDHEWVEANVESLHESFRPHCESFGRCLSVWGNPVDFCRLLLTLDVRAICQERFDISTDGRGWQQCRAVGDIFSVAQHQTGLRAWPGIQACAAGEAGEGGVPSPVVELDPPAPKPSEGVEVTVKAFHPDTGVPMYGLVTIEGTMRGPTFQPIRYALQFSRSTDDLGRITMRPPEIVVLASPARGSNAPAFAPVITSFSTPVPGTELTLDPPPGEWKAGKNMVRVTARDAESGAELEGSILRAGAVVGSVGELVLIELRGEASPCGDPLWFRPREANRPDASLPVPPCR